MATPHNGAEKGAIAKTGLMPGDPLRAKFVAETYLENPVCFNTVRGMLGFTGTWKGRRVSVMGSGMGMPSIGIYSYELFHFYDVDRIIRIGTAGGLADDVQLRDVIVAVGSCTDSRYAAQFRLPGTFAPLASFRLARLAVEKAEQLGFPVKAGSCLLYTSCGRRRRSPGTCGTADGPDKGCFRIEPQRGGRCPPGCRRRCGGRCSAHMCGQNTVPAPLPAPAPRCV